jgi:hypothetical protein
VLEPQSPTLWGAFWSSSDLLAQQLRVPREWILPYGKVAGKVHISLA